jgi:hypothetical protein
VRAPKAAIQRDDPPLIAGFAAGANLLARLKFPGAVDASALAPWHSTMIVIPASASQSEIRLRAERDAPRFLTLALGAAPTWGARASACHAQAFEGGAP